MRDLLRSIFFVIAACAACLNVAGSPASAADEAEFRFVPAEGWQGAWRVTVHLERDVWGVGERGFERSVASYEGALSFDLVSRLVAEKDGPRIVSDSSDLAVIEGWTSPEGQGERTLKGDELSVEGLEHGAYDPYEGMISNKKRPPFWKFCGAQTSDGFNSRAVCAPAKGLNWRSLLSDYSGACFGESLLPLPLPTEPLKKKRSYFERSNLTRVAGLKLTEPVGVTMAASWSRSDEDGHLFLIRGGAEKRNVRTGVVVPDPVGSGERELALELNKLARVHSGEILLNQDCTLRSTRLEILTDGELTLDQELMGYSQFTFSEKLIIGFEKK